MTQHQNVIQRDYYYQRTVTWKDRLGFAALTVFGHFAVFMFLRWAVDGLLEMWRGTATYVIFEIILTIPAAFILPLYGMNLYLKKIIPPLYSLADEPALRHKKMLSLLGFGEALRFVLGLLPTSLTLFGTVTSPVTMMLYTLLYMNPTGRYEAILIQGDLRFTDAVAFAAIYLSYFVLHEWIVLRMFHKRHSSHLRYLAGNMAEYDKEQNYRPAKTSPKLRKEDESHLNSL